MNLQEEIEALNSCATALSEATSIRDKVKYADHIYDLLAECEKLVEQFIVSEIGNTNGHKRTPSEQKPTEERIVSKKYKGMKLAEVGWDLLKDRGTLHGSEIEKRAKAGGYHSDSQHFQSYLATAFDRDGRFENTGKNNWKIKENADSQAA